MKAPLTHSRVIRAIGHIALLALVSTTGRSAVMDIEEISVDSGSNPPHSVFLQTGKPRAIEGWMAAAPLPNGSLGSWDSSAGTLSFAVNIYGTAAQAAEHKQSGIVGRATAAGTGISGASKKGGGDAPSTGSIQWTVTGASGKLLSFLSANYKDLDAGPSTSFVFATPVLSGFYPSHEGSDFFHGSHSQSGELSISSPQNARRHHREGHDNGPLGVEIEIELEIEDMVPVPEASTTLAGFAAGGMLLIHLVRARRAALRQAR